MIEIQVQFFCEPETVALIKRVISGSRAIASQPLLYSMAPSELVQDNKKPGLLLWMSPAVASCFRVGNVTDAILSVGNVNRFYIVISLRRYVAVRERAQRRS